MPLAAALAQNAPIGYRATNSYNRAGILTHIFSTVNWKHKKRYSNTTAVYASLLDTCAVQAHYSSSSSSTVV